MRKLTHSKIGVVTTVLITGAVGIGAWQIPQAFKSTVVSVTASCTSNCTGTVTLSATAPIQATSVTFYENGVAVGTDFAAPFSLSWDTTTVADSTYTVTATASGSVSSATSSGVSVAIANGTSLANVWIDSNGGTCTRSSAAAYVDAAACGTITSACAAASAGDTIRVRAGTYAMQTVTCTGGSSGSPITILPDVSSTVQFGPSTTLSTSSVTFYQNGEGGPSSFDVTDSAAAALWVTAGSQVFTVGQVPVYCSTRSGASFSGCFAQAGAGCVGTDGGAGGSTDSIIDAVENCTVTSGSRVYEGGITVTGASNLTFKNLTAPVTTVQKTTSGALDGITFDGMTDNLLYVTGNVTNLMFKNGAVGPNLNAKPTITGGSSGGGFVPQNITIQDTTFRGMTRNQSANPAVHTECLQITAGEFITINRDKFDVCDGTAAFAVANDLGTADNVTVTNSWFGSNGDATTAVQLSTAVTTQTWSYNTFAEGVTINNTCTSCGISFVGNYGVSVTCKTGVTYDKDLWQTGTCTGDNTATGVAPQVVSTADPFNLDLSGGSNAIDKGDTGSYPTVDIHGTTRYLGAAPDVGADEKG